jgi:hypothetical protein
MAAGHGRTNEGFRQNVAILDLADMNRASGTAYIYVELFIKVLAAFERSK